MREVFTIPAKSRPLNSTVRSLPIAKHHASLRLHRGTIPRYCAVEQNLQPKDCHYHGQRDHDDSRLPATAELSLEGDVAAQMIAGIHRYLDRELAAADSEAEESLRSLAASAKH